ncbi:DEAD/DEAH box helicase [Leptospira bandrabouensis]|uniref:DEAD/DEAH box helicase n=1 Tax=Leptospira bandrabouensis TaxID=2484903 RepID=A0A6H3NJT7_9LEPT|nr:DEAD/DEAH box helicase [Leptospira bandrabouensis]
MLNPIVYTEKIVEDFLSYLITNYRFASEELQSQMENLLDIKSNRNTPILNGLYISLSQFFKAGKNITELIHEGILHDYMEEIAQFPDLYLHQENAIRAADQGQSMIISTGTGSGKTESFLFPIINHLLKLKDRGEPEGIRAIIIYPMNALAEDQMDRLREYLVGTGISFGLYVGTTPENDTNYTEQNRNSKVYRLTKEENTKQGYNYWKETYQSEGTNGKIIPLEERVTRESMQTPGKQPRILLTNIMQLELLLTRRKDESLFDNASLDYIVVDEAHTFKGVQGAETAVLLRRLKAFHPPKTGNTIHIATSATILDKERGDEPGREFASRFFGLEKDSLTLIREVYDQDAWHPDKNFPQLPVSDKRQLLNQLLKTLDDVESNPKPFLQVFQEFTGIALREAEWNQELFEYLTRNSLLYEIVQMLRKPKKLDGLVEELAKIVAREITEDEILIWLALGITAKKSEKPLIRPIVHAFLEGMGGAVVTFHDKKPKLWMKAEQAEKDKIAGELAKFNVLNCTRCGQHYYEHYLEDFFGFDKEPKGGHQHGDHTYWQSSESLESQGRIVFTDHFTTDEEEGLSFSSLQICTKCGTLHSHQVNSCSVCNSNKVQEIYWIFPDQKVSQQEASIKKCPVCMAEGRKHGGQYREPIRPLRAVTVSDVAILGQAMIQHQESSRRRLLIFSDNRQDAAFQAGWMRDHAKRFRIRSLMYKYLEETNHSIESITEELKRFLEKNQSVSKIIAQEVEVKNLKDNRANHEENKYKFIKIKVLDELVTSASANRGLEPVGKLILDYHGIEKEDELFHRWSKGNPEHQQEIFNGVLTILDALRKRGILHTGSINLFSRKWNQYNEEVSDGFIRVLKSNPRGLLKVLPEDIKSKDKDYSWLYSFTGERNLITMYIRSWGIFNDNELSIFQEELWEYLLQTGILIETYLYESRGTLKFSNRAFKLYQIDHNRIFLRKGEGIYRCKKCKKTYSRNSAFAKCISYRCDGELEFEETNPNHYDHKILTREFSMVIPEEHSAQVNTDHREIRERTFKSDSDAINTLVCTPTLELGLDIGSLDGVLLRNVPPEPANYWQRVGRAGRRLRMAVNLTYCRQASHDKSYFQNPMSMLDGLVVPPSFNLHNEIMIRSHAHSSILTSLYQLASSVSTLEKSEKDDINETIKNCLPKNIKKFLFKEENDHYRESVLDVSADWNQLLQKYKTEILENLGKIFTQKWVEDSKHLVTESALSRIIDNFGFEYQEVINQVWDRLQFLRKKIDELSLKKSAQGNLDTEDQELDNRYQTIIKRLKGILPPRKSNKELYYRESTTFGVLGAEGFFPGYGFSGGNIRIDGLQKRFRTEVNFMRPSSLALREYVPGNMIYIDGEEFVTKRYSFRNIDDPVFIEFEADQLIVEEFLPGLEPKTLNPRERIQAIPISDVQIESQSRVSEEEESRFQLPVTIVGSEKGSYGEGKRYKFNNHSSLRFRKNVEFRMFNMGATVKTDYENRKYGYPVCIICGQSASPLSSAEYLTQFYEKHVRSCNFDPSNHIVFFSDIIVDTLTFDNLPSDDLAYSLGESLRMACDDIIDMDLEDIQILVTPSQSGSLRNLHLYDPILGGCGILNKLIDRWDDIVKKAIYITENCSGVCDESCINCLRTYRNAYYHRFLKRKEVSNYLHLIADNPIFIDETAPEFDSSKKTTGVDLKEVFIEKCRKYDLPIPKAKMRLNLGVTNPKVEVPLYIEINKPDKKGICLYFTPPIVFQEAYNNEWDGDFEDNGYEVIRIKKEAFKDKSILASELSRLARKIFNKSFADDLKERILREE